MSTPPDPRFHDGLRLVATKTAISCARLFVEQTLRQWGAGFLVDDAAKVADELVTTAVNATGIPEERVRTDIVDTLDPHIRQVQQQNPDSTLITTIEDDRSPMITNRSTTHPCEVDSIRKWAGSSFMRRRQPQRPTTRPTVNLRVGCTSLHAGTPHAEVAEHMVNVFTSCSGLLPSCAGQCFVTVWRAVPEPITASGSMQTSRKC